MFYHKWYANLIILILTFFKVNIKYYSSIITKLQNFDIQRFYKTIRGKTN